MPDFSLCQLLDQLLLHGIALFLQRLPFGEDEPVSVAIDFDDFQSESCTGERGHLSLLLNLITSCDGSHLRCGYEASHPVKVYQQTAFVVVDDFSVQNGAIVVLLLEVSPGLLLSCPVN